MLLAYPYEDIVIRFQPGRVNEQIQDARPSRRAWEGQGPFVIEGDCKTKWELKPDKKADRVKLRIG